MTSSPLQPSHAPWSNWSGGQTCQPNAIFEPASENELADFIRQHEREVRVVGAGHSFSAVVPTNSALVRLKQLSGIISIDADSSQVTLGGGTTIREIGEPLLQQQLALINQGDVDPQCVAGACATGTHGTGLEFGCLATDLVGFRLVTAHGEILDCSPMRNSEIFRAGRVSLGSFGIMSQVTIRCRSAYALHERVAVMGLDECLDRVDELAASNRHFEFFQFPYADRVLVKTMNVAEMPSAPSSNDEDEDRIFRWACNIARIAPVLNPVLQRTGMRWYPGRQRCDYSYRIFPSARTVRFNEMEYEVPADAGVACYREVLELIRRKRMPVCFPLEFRRVKGDDIWLSPFYGRDSISISIHEHHRADYGPLFDLLEPIFWEYEGRPHWGKLHTLSAEQLRPLYPRWNDFTELRKQLDPQGKFLNDHLRALFGQSTRG